MGLTILFQVASLGAILFRGGLLGFNQPVAALEQLRLFPYTVTVGQYVFLTLACQVFAAVVLSILLTTISAPQPIQRHFLRRRCHCPGRMPAAGVHPTQDGMAGGPFGPVQSAQVL